jgi:hypothetical protein
MRRLTIIIALVLFSATSVAAKDWRGLLPLHSTREDVEKLLGPPPSPSAHPYRSYSLSKGRSIYLLDEGEVYIVFAEKEFPAANPCLLTLAAGTVLMIQITPKSEPLLSDLRIDESKLRKFNPSITPGGEYGGFVNEEEGLIIRTFKGKVQEIVYVASALDRPRCPSYYESLEAFVQVGEGCRLRFDEYGDISFRDEKARLDNFAIQMLNQPETKGYVIVYAGRRATVAEALLRANRAKDYLVNVRGIDPQRVQAIDGGYRVDFSVLLHLGSKDAEPPPLMPTVDPSQVEIVYEKKQRRQKKP